MGWERRGVRKDRWYLYRNERVNGKVVKTYLARASHPAAVELMEHGLRAWHRRRRMARVLAQAESADLRERVGGLLADVDAANGPLRETVEWLLAAAGFHRHHRGEWRMKRAKDNEPQRAKDVPAGFPDHLVLHHAPTGDAAAEKLFAKARAGDKAALKKLREWLTERGQLDHYGDLGMRATFTLVARATGGEPVWRAAVEEKVRQMTAELLGPHPTVLERLLVRWVVNGWVAVYALELELTIRPPARKGDRAYLEAAVGRAQRRMTQAVTELARVRRLKLPPVLVNVTPPQQASKPAIPAGV